MEKRVSKVEALPRLAPEFRVAAYARVSSEKDAMRHSLSAQVSYYSNLIQSHPGWQYAGVYADEPISGTKDCREEFQRMLSDCRAGKINMIITKSISRFARNTVTLLETVRELKDLGIDVFFEEQNIHSKSADGELMLTILASYAQEESRSVSENMKWRIRKAFEKGEIMCWRFLFGYRISKERGIEIDPVVGPIAQEVFRRVAEGASLNSVARWLNQNGYYGALGGKWQTPRLRDMLSNEKYTGNALLQKTYKNNHLEKKTLTNHGELPQYYATETHPALIDPDTFARVQQRLAEIAVMSVNKRKPRTTNEFTGMIRCPHCGRNFRRIHMRGAPNWVCPTYYTEGKAYCQSKKIPETTLRKTLGAVLHIDPWLPEVFSSLVEYIIATGPNTLEVHLRDGTVNTLEWKDRSRAESWTPEMREKAREHALRRHHG